MTRFLTADEAAERLGVRKATLYTYASRGWIRTRRDGRRRAYAAEDVDYLRARAEAVAGEGPAAAGALDWGAPVLATAITRIGPDGPRYRGRPAVALAESDTTFEEVFDLLVDARPPGGRRWFPTEPAPAAPEGAVGPTVAGRLLTEAARFAALGRAGTEPEAIRQRVLVRWLAAAVAAPPGPVGGGGIAAALAAAWGVADGRERWLERALVVCADHELNASAFAARVAAGTGADTPACVVAALAAWSGPRHGGATDAVERTVDGIRTAADAERAIAGVSDPAGLPGFGHRLYPDGDPRAVALLRWSAALDPAQAAPLLAFAARGADATGEAPALDLGLVVFARALRLPPGSAGALFAIGRCAGWIAHVVEQRQSGRLLRPRAAPA